MQITPAAKRLWLAVPLVLCWLTGTAYAFWVFEVRDLRSFDSPGREQAARFDARALTAPLAAADEDLSRLDRGDALVLHFWNPDCGCNKFNNPHVRTIIDTYRPQGVRFVTVVKTQPGRDNQELLARAQEIFRVPAVADSSLRLEQAALPGATPAAAVVTAQGRVDYFGPYSNSAVCGQNSDTPVEDSLDRIIAGNEAPGENTLAFGCFCQWQKDNA